MTKESVLNNISDDYTKMNRRRMPIGEMHFLNGYDAGFLGKSFEEISFLASDKAFLEGYRQGILDYDKKFQDVENYVTEIQSVAIRVRKDMV